MMIISTNLEPAIRIKMRCVFQYSDYSNSVFLNNVQLNVYIEEKCLG